MLHGAIFLAACVGTNVALQVARKISRVTAHFFNLQCKQMLRKTYCERVTPPLQLAMFFSRHRCVASCKKNCPV